MIEQKVTINLKDKFSNTVGTLTISSIDFVDEINIFPMSSSW